MTDRHDIQRARRYIVDVAMTREEFRRKFPAQFVRNNQDTLERSGAFRMGEAMKVPEREVRPAVVAPAQKVRHERKLTKRVKIRHHYMIYNLRTHRLVGKWHGRNRKTDRKGRS